MVIRSTARDKPFPKWGIHLTLAQKKWGIYLILRA